LYRADSEAQLDGLLGPYRSAIWMQVTVPPLDPHPNDPTRTPASLYQLPDPLSPVYRLEATVGEPLDLGEICSMSNRGECATARPRCSPV
jgi:hypothetical protein